MRGTIIKKGFVWGVDPSAQPPAAFPAKDDPGKQVGAVMLGFPDDPPAHGLDFVKFRFADIGRRHAVRVEVPAVVAGCVKHLVRTEIVDQHAVLVGGVHCAADRSCQKEGLEKCVYSAFRFRVLYKFFALLPVAQRAVPGQWLLLALELKRGLDALAGAVGFILRDREHDVDLEPAGCA